MAHAAFIATLTIKSLIDSKAETELIDLPETATIEEAFDILLANDILSVPVYQPNGNTKRYVGIVGVLDLVRYTVIQPSLEQLKGDPTADLPTLRHLRQTATFLDSPLSAIIGYNSTSTADAIGSELKTLTSSTPFLELLTYFTTHRLHRVLVIDPDKNPVLVSQSDAVRFLFAHNHQLGKILDMSAALVAGAAARRQPTPTAPLTPPHRHTVDTVSFHCTALQAFSQLIHYPHSALPILDDGGEMVAEVSAEDLRGLNHDRLGDMLKPLLYFLKLSQGRLRPPLTCNAKFTLSQVMAGFTRANGHRMWLVDDTVQGVITLTDVLSVFL